MRTIAEKAGVSKVTVSLALRNHPSIPESTRKRIHRWAEKLNYRPNPMVSTLMAQLNPGRTSTESPILSLILEEGWRYIYKQVSFYHDLLNGARQRAARLGYHLEDCYLEPGEKAAGILHRNLHARNVRGVIVGPLFHAGGRCDLPLNGLACCALGYSLHTPDIHRVVSNYAQNMRLVWTKLLERGYKRPGFVVLLDHLQRTYFERLGAFTAQQSSHPELAVIPPLIFEDLTDHNTDEYVQKLVAWFNQHQPDVIIFPPWALLKKLRQHLRVPEQVGVIISDYEPGWTQAMENAHQIGSASVDMVVAQIHRNENGVPEFPMTVGIPSTWVEGFSLPYRKG